LIGSSQVSNKVLGHPHTSFSGIQLRGRISLARDLAAEEEVRLEHVWAGGGGMFGRPLWNPVCKPDMSGISENFGWKIVFDVLHFTNAYNASLLIVRRSYDTNKIKTL
jgi:hypothetical protein